MSVGKFLGGFVVGAALGAVAGLLLAPKSGAETREMLSDTAKDVMELVQYTKDQIYSKFGKIIELEIELIGEK